MVTVDLKTKDKKGQTKVEKYRYQVKKLPDIIKVGEKYKDDWKVRVQRFSHMPDICSYFHTVSHCQIDN